MLRSSVQQATGLVNVCTRCPLQHSIPQSSSSTSHLIRQHLYPRLLSTAIVSHASERTAGSKFGLATTERFNAPPPRRNASPAQGGTPPTIGVAPFRNTPSSRTGSDVARPGQGVAGRTPNPSFRGPGPQTRKPPIPSDGRLNPCLHPSAPQQVRRSLGQTIDFLKESRARDSLDHALSSSEEHHTTRHLGTDVDFSQMPSQPRFMDEQRRVVKFHLLNLEENLPLKPKLIRTSVECPAFVLRLLPREQTPHRRTPPFPAHLIDHGKKAHRSIGLGIVTSKVRMSKYAFERNRARRRIMEALGYVVNRGVMCPPGVDGWDLVSEDMSYVFHLYPPSILLPMDQLCQQIYTCLDTVRARAAKGGKWQSRR